MGDRRVFNAWNWQAGRVNSTQVSLELFLAALDESVLQDLHERLARSRLSAADSQGWKGGVPTCWAGRAA